MGAFALNLKTDYDLILSVGPFLNQYGPDLVLSVGPYMNEHCGPR